MKPARIISVRDKNGATYWVVHPEDRIVREVVVKTEERTKKGKRR